MCYGTGHSYVHKKKIAIAARRIIHIERARIWTTNERRKKTHKFNTYHGFLLHTVHVWDRRLCSSIVCVCVCVFARENVCVALTKVHFPPTLWFNFLCCQPKTTVRSLLSHVCSPLCYPIATTMNLPRQQNGNEKKKITTWKWNGKIAEFHNWTASEAAVASAATTTTTTITTTTTTVRTKKATQASRTCDVRTEYPRFIYFLMLFSSRMWVCVFFCLNSL